MTVENQTALGLLIAALSGAAIGMERQRSGQASGRAAHFGGLRTFTLLGFVSGFSGILWTNHIEAAAAILLASAAVLILIAYFAASRVDMDATTEVSALVVLAAGLMAGLGWWALSSGVIAITYLLLMEKRRLHDLSASLPDAGLKAGARFAVMALVILPLLPEGPFGPLGGIRPRELWMIVLLISGLSFAGYAARFVVGAQHGYVVTGILGGLVSSTNATMTLAKVSASDPGSSKALAVGVIAACSVMYLRVAAATAILNPLLGVALIAYWIPPALCGTAIALYGLRRRVQVQEHAAFPEHPLALLSALQMAVLFQGVLFIITAVRQSWGSTGMVATGAVLGLTDVDALTISMSKSSEGLEQIATAALAIAVGCLANSFFKLGIAMVFGKGDFRRYAAIGFTVLIVSGAAVIGWKMLL